MSQSIFDIISNKHTNNKITNVNIKEIVKSSSYLVERLSLLKSLEGHTGCVNSVLFSEDGNLIYTGSDDTKINIYDTNTCVLKNRIVTKHTNNIFYVKDLPKTNGDMIVTCAADGLVLLMDTVKNTTTKLFKHNGRAHRLSLIPDSPYQFYSCGEDGKCCFFDIRTFNSSTTSSTNSSSSSSMNSLNDLSVVKTLFKDKNNSSTPIYCIHVNPVKNYEIAVAGSAQYLAIYDARKFTKPISYFAPSHLINSSDHITGVKFNYSGDILVASYNDEDVYTFDVNKHSKQSVSELTISSKESINQSNDMISIDDTISNETTRDTATSGLDSNITNEYTGYINRFSGHRNNDTVKQVSYYGYYSEFIVSGSDCGNLFIWDAKSSKIINILEADSIGAINCIDNHPNYPYLVTSGLDNDAKLWAPVGSYEPNHKKIDSYDEIVKKNINRRKRYRLSSSNESGFSSRTMMRMLLRYISNSSDNFNDDVPVIFESSGLIRLMSRINSRYESEESEDIEEDEDNEDNEADHDEGNNEDNEEDEEDEIHDDEDNEDRIKDDDDDIDSDD